MDKAFISWLNQSIVWEVFASQDGALRKLFNAPVTVPCFIQGRKTYVRTLAGEQVLSNRVIYVNGTDKPTGASVRDRITYQGIEWPMLGYSEMFDEKGTLDHVEVYV
jgi:hypothetical protein